MTRFIIAAPQCSIKPLSRALPAVLKFIYKQIETYNWKLTSTGHESLINTLLKPGQ